MKKNLTILLRYWKIFANKFVVFQTAIILSIIYCLGIGMMSIFLKFLHKDLLNKKLVNCTTFWIDKDKEDRTIERARQQF